MKEKKSLLFEENYISVHLISKRGNSEPWAYQGDIFLATSVEEVKAHLKSNSPLVSKRSISANQKRVLDEYMEDVHRLETTVVLENPKIDTPKKARFSNADTSPTGDTNHNEKLEITNKKDTQQKDTENDIQFSYTMDEFERWANADGFAIAQELETGPFWPAGETRSPRAPFSRLAEEMEFPAVIGEVRDRFGKGRDAFLQFLGLIFAGLPIFDHLLEEITEDCVERLAHLVFGEMVIWRINGTAHLRQSLLDMRILEYPQFRDSFECFQIPICFTKAFELQAAARHDLVAYKEGLLNHFAFD